MNFRITGLFARKKILVFLLGFVSKKIQHRIAKIAE